MSIGPLAHEELLTLFLKNPTVLSEYRRQLTAEMFDYDSPIMQVMLDIDAQGEWEWRDVHHMVGDDNKNRVRNLISGFASVRLVEHLITKTKQTHLDRGLKYIGRFLTDENIPANERLREMQAQFDKLQNASMNVQMIMKLGLMDGMTT